MTFDKDIIIFNSDKADVSYIKTIVYEVLVVLQVTIVKLKDLVKPSISKSENTTENTRIELNFSNILEPTNIIPSLKAKTKFDAIEEMIERLTLTEHVLDKKAVYNSVYERELLMSTGMQDGIALPHGKDDNVAQQITACIGISKEGIDFESLDEKPAHIICMLISNKSESAPHLQFLSIISAILNSEEVRNQIINAESSDEIWEIIRDTQRKSGGTIFSQIIK